MNFFGSSIFVLSVAKKKWRANVTTVLQTRQLINSSPPYYVSINLTISLRINRTKENDVVRYYSVFNYLEFCPKRRFNNSRELVIFLYIRLFYIYVFFI